MLRLVSVVLSTLASTLVFLACSSGSSGSAGGACSGGCATPGSTCSIDPPAGSDAPSARCTCSESRVWDCGGTGGTGGGATTGGSGGTATGGGGATTGGTGGGQCVGACDPPGARCTIDPPPGSLAPSVLCICSDVGEWCCDSRACLDTGGTGGGGATGGSGGSATGGSGASGASGGMGGLGASGGAGATGGTGGGCMEDCASQGFTCCNGACVNTGNDINNCGGCDVTCGGTDPYCGGGQCGAAPCGGCTGGQLCCDVNVGPTTTSCVDPVDGTCPRGCPFCVCASADTRVATPAGEVTISDIRTGDVVYGVSGEAIVPVVVLETNRVPVMDHVMVEVRLASGRTVRMSPRHPTVDGRRFDSLVPGAPLGAERVESVRVVPYTYGFTYDILTDTPSGAYFAEGALVGSTLVR